MPSKLDDTELDARWRAGLAAAAEPGRWVEADTRVAGHVTARRRHRRVTGVVAIAATVVAAIAVVVVATRHTGTKVRTADSAPRIALAGGSASQAVGISQATAVLFDPDGPHAETAYGHRFQLGIQSSIAGEWRLTVDENPAVTVAVTNLDTQATTAATGTTVEADPGTYSVTISGTPRGSTEPAPAVHGTLTVLAEPPGPPVATVTVTALPTLTMTMSPPRVPAGVIEFDYRDGGGTHALIVKDLPGFELMVPNGPTSGRLELAPGTYELACLIPGHDQAGEHATLTVVAP